MKTTNVLFFALLFAVLMSACSSDNAAAVKPSELVGTWVCVSGSTVDGEPAELLIKDEKTSNPGAVIEFSESVMKFELLKDLEKSAEQPYKLEASKIVFTNDKELSFDIKNKDDKKMTIAFKVAGHAFELVMERK